MTLRVAVGGASVVALLIGVMLARLLASPELSVWADAIALGSVSLLFGLGLLGLVDAEPSPAAVAVVASVWGASSAISAWLQVAERAGADPFAVGIGDVADGVESGLPVVISVVGALGVIAWAWWTPSDAYVVGAVAAVGVLVTSVTGHAGTSLWIPLVVGVHALAAAWWVGTLGALVVTVRGRGGWARSLPAFSRSALPVVATLTVTGLAAAVGRIGFDWWTTGYGRVVIAKLVLLIVVAGIAVWHRRAWLAKARRHRLDESTSIRNAGIEIVLLTVVLGLAAGLSVTG
ncbi:copper resistance protein D [Gordonia spumicola]|uniref:Copper resistance protein D n=1 Tax=Gordonia spumicola TaxID=589161 RepID=A0A7I9V7C2_9ACTN|nr:CopD family protein [Gordonia spumicola]GEE01134.1 copper resistance protein D [Gordonia spumicola]